MEENKKEITKDISKLRRIEMVSSKGDYELVISNDLQNKINNLIMFAPQSKEWSGILFYKATGEFDNKDNPLVITAVDLLLKDLGSSVFTTFEYDPEVATYIAMNNLTEAYLGLIHSHHFMSTSPSGTDMDTVYKEGLDMNHFVSLIVNNEGTYTGLLTRRIKINIKQADLYYNTFNDKWVDVSEVTPYTEDYLLEYYNLKVFTEGDIIYDNEVIDRIEELKKIESNKPVYNKPNPIYGNISGEGDLFRQGYVDYDYIEKRVFSNYPIQANNDHKVIKETSFNIDEIIISLLTTKILLNKVDKKLKYKEFISKTMTELYKEKFDNNLKVFEDFANSWIDLIINFNVPSSARKALKTVEYQTIIAKGLLSKLDESKSTNKYVLVYKKILKEYYIYG